MGFNDPVSVDEAMAHTVGTRTNPQIAGAGNRRSWQLYLSLLLLFAASVYLACIISPPSLMDDSDAIEAQIGANMLASGDWVTAQLNGVAYMEKSPFNFWLEAITYSIFGTHDWA